jgi:hypothetical protein
MKTLQELERQLFIMRRQADEYATDPEHDAAELLRMRSECAALWGAIECVKKGTKPEIAAQAKFLNEVGDQWESTEPSWRL